jgi:hypothetical protein
MGDTTPRLNHLRRQILRIALLDRRGGQNTLAMIHPHAAQGQSISHAVQADACIEVVSYALDNQSSCLLDIATIDRVGTDQEGFFFFPPKATRLRSSACRPEP